MNRLTIVQKALEILQQSFNNLLRIV